MIRLQRFLADAGVASRRGGEKLILEGRVKVNGRVVQELGTKVDPAKDQVEVDGSMLRSRRKHYVALHKPAGYLCTRKDTSNRPTIFDLLPAEWHHLHPVGRLDMDTEGLLFLTNDGQFTLQLTHPRYGISKWYKVTVAGRVEQVVAEKMVQGVQEGGDLLKAVSVKLVSISNKKTVFDLELKEGKNREVRRLCAALGLEVLRLRRLRVGPIKLGELPEGKWRALTDAEIKTLLATNYET